MVPKIGHRAENEYKSKHSPIKYTGNSKSYLNPIANKRRKVVNFAGH